MRVYIIENLLNGDRYIGQTVKTGKSYDDYYGSGLYIKRAVKKYGKENFNKSILCICNSKDQLNRMERLYIKLLKPEYNIAEGGKGGNLGAEINKKKALNQIGRKNPKLAELNRLNKKGQTPWNKGKKGIYSEETIQRFKIAAKLREQKKREAKNG